jgi:hypothetical protein
MSSLSRLVPIAFAGMLGGAAACGGGDSTGPKAGSVTGLAGDGQSAPTGATLASPVSFVVLGGDGFPLKGAKISWSVAPASAATVDPKSQTTDATGLASTTVTLGSVQGPLTVTAAVNGVSPVQFHITALDPCSFVAPYSLGATVSGTLARTDCKQFGFFYDFYQLDLPTGGQQSIRISMASTKFDTYVELFRSTGEPVGADDDIESGVIQNSQLDVIMGDGGTFVIGANSYDPDTVGAYTLSSAERPATLSGCQDAWVTPGATIVDAVETTDCLFQGQNFDIIYMFIPGGSVIRLAERSTAINPLLKLESLNLTTGAFDSVAANDDSIPATTTAFISYTVAASAILRVRIGTAVAGTTGAYTFAFSPSTTPGPTAGRTAGAPRMLPFLPLRTLKGWKAKL